MTVTVLSDRKLSQIGFDFEITSARGKHGVLDFEGQFLSGEWQHKVRDFDITTSAAYIGPLLVFRDERAVEPRRYAASKQKLSRKLSGHGCGAAHGKLRKHLPSDFLRHFPIHDPKRETNTIPAQIA